MFGLLSGRISDAGLTDRPGSWANADAAALKSMKAKKQSARQARVSLINTNVTLQLVQCRRGLTRTRNDGLGSRRIQMTAGKPSFLGARFRRAQVYAFPHGEVRQCLLHAYHRTTSHDARPA